MSERSELEAFAGMLGAKQLFASGSTVVVARAPGRLDVMGGIADYSGSLVLQRPTAEATFVAAQRTGGDALEIVSLGRAPCVLPLETLAPGGRPAGYEGARRLFTGDGTGEAGEATSWPHWASYVAGPLLVLWHETGASVPGMRIVVDSRVPEGKGVSSSAALETATMQAAAVALGVTVEPYDLALMCQRSENLVSGAPCGVMDQMTCVFGERDRLMALLCQPARLQPPVTVPSGVAFWGLDSGERHAVGGSDYGAVRTGAFMGLRMLATQHGVPENYLANITPSEFEREYEGALPEMMSGAEFLARFGGIADVVTKVEPGRHYRVRAAAAHPVHERQRAETFRQILAGHIDDDSRVRLGSLMYESHASYGTCGLGSPGTDLLVDLVRAEGPAGGLYGARITGGGSGGTVAVVGRPDAGAAIARVVEAYEQRTGYRPYLFAGSSSGVMTVGTATFNV